MPYTDRRRSSRPEEGLADRWKERRPVERRHHYGPVAPGFLEWHKRFAGGHQREHGPGERAWIRACVSRRQIGVPAGLCGVERGLRFSVSDRQMVLVEIAQGGQPIERQGLGGWRSGTF